VIVKNVAIPILLRALLAALPHAGKGTFKRLLHTMFNHYYRRVVREGLRSRCGRMEELSCSIMALLTNE